MLKKMAKYLNLYISNTSLETIVHNEILVLKLYGMFCSH